MKKIFLMICIMIALLFTANYLISSDDSDDSSTESVASNLADLFDGSESEEENFDESYTAFAYDQLDEEGKHAYQNILQGLLAHEEETDVAASDVNIIADYYSAVLVDHPEIFWVSGNTEVWTTVDPHTFTVESDYIVEPEQIDAVNQQIEAAANQFIFGISTDASAYDKVKATYEYIILNNDYNLNSENNQNIQSVFINHVSVCAGYAKSFQYLLNKMGIPTLYIECYANNEAHALNMVQIDGSYYYVDCTWGDPQYGLESDSYAQDIVYDYLCLTTAEIIRTHSFDTNPLELPDASDRTYDYYILNGDYYESFDDNAALDALYAGVRNQETVTSMKFANWDAYALAVQRIFTDDLIDGPARELMDAQGITTYQYHYDTDDYLMIIRIYW